MMNPDNRSNHNPPGVASKPGASLLARSPWRPMTSAIKSSPKAGQDKLIDRVSPVLPRFVRNALFLPVLIMLGGLLPAERVRAQTFTYDFPGTMGNGGTVATQTQSAPTGGTFSDFARVGLTANSTSGVFNSTGYDVNGTAINPAKYTTYSLTPAAGNVSFVQTDTFQVLSSGTGPTNGQASVFGDTSSVALASTTYTIPTSGSTLSTKTLSVNVITGEALTFRFYGYGGTGAGGTSRLDNVATNSATTNFAASSANLALVASTQVYANSTALALSGIISGGFGITKTGGNTLTLTGANTYNGTTTVSSGGLTLADTTGTALVNTTQVSVNNGGTFMLGASNQVNTIATVALGGGSGTGTANFSTGNNTQSLGALTLNASANITLGGGGSTLRFANSSGSTFSGTLSILNYSGTVYLQDGTTTAGTPGDALYFGTDSTGLGTNLAQLQFVNPAGYTGTFGAIIGSDGEVFAEVPEPATIFAGLLMAGALGWSQRRRLGGMAGSMRTCLAA